MLESDLSVKNHRNVVSWYYIFYAWPTLWRQTT